MNITQIQEEETIHNLSFAAYWTFWNNCSALAIHLYGLDQQNIGITAVLIKPSQLSRTEVNDR